MSRFYGIDTSFQRSSNNPLNILKNGIPFIIIQYNPILLSKTQGKTGEKFLLSLVDIFLGTKVFITKFFPESVSSKKELSWSELQVPGTYQPFISFSKAGSENYDLSITLARVNEFLGVQPELEFFKDFLRPQAQSSWLGSLFENQPSGKFVEDIFIEPPKAMIIGLTGIFPALYIVKSVDFTLRDYNSFNYPTIADVKLSITYLPNPGLDKARIIFEKFISNFLGIISSVGILRKNINTYQGTSIFLEFLNSFEFGKKSFSTSLISGIFEGILGDSEENLLTLEEQLFLIKYIQSGGDTVAAISAMKGLSKIEKKGYRFKL